MVERNSLLRRLGTAVWTDEGAWHISGHAAVVLAALPPEPGEPLGAHHAKRST